MIEVSEFTGMVIEVSLFMVVLFVPVYSVPMFVAVFIVMMAFRALRNVVEVSLTELNNLFMIQTHDTFALQIEQSYSKLEKIKPLYSRYHGDN